MICFTLLSAIFHITTIQLPLVQFTIFHLGNATIDLNIENILQNTSYVMQYSTNIWHSLILVLFYRELQNLRNLKSKVCKVLKNTEIKITILRQAGQHTKLILMPFWVSIQLLAESWFHISSWHYVFTLFSRWLPLMMMMIKRNASPKPKVTWQKRWVYKFMHVWASH